MLKEIMMELKLRWKEHPWLFSLLIPGTLMIPVAGWFCINSLMTIMAVSISLEPPIMDFLPMTDREKKSRKLFFIIGICLMATCLLTASLAIGQLSFYQKLPIAKGIRHAGTDLMVMWVCLFFLDNACSMTVRARKRFVDGKEPVYLMVMAILTEIGIVYILLFDFKAGLRLMQQSEVKYALGGLVLALAFRWIREIRTYWRAPWRDRGSDENMVTDSGISGEDRTEVE